MKIYIPIRGYDWPAEIESCNQEYERLLDELSLLNNDERLIKLLDENGENKFALEGIEFSVIRGSENRTIINLHKKFPDFFIMYIWEFIIVDLKFIKRIKSVDTSLFYPNLYLRQIALLLGLTFGTPIEFLPGLVLKGRKYIGMTGYIGGPFNQAYDSMNELKWPQFLMLNFEQVISWFTKHDIHLNQISNSAASRAVNAYSHLFNYSLGETDTAFIFWCLLGIESLFSRGNNGILQQIQSKVNLVLGEPQQFQKKLKKLYEYRSRLVHGELNFPPKSSKDFGSFYFEYQDYVGFACSLLIASIKTQIINDISDFEFSLTWKSKLAGT